MNSSQKTTLPPKELSLFKRIVKSYEQKQYKNGLKFARQILSNPKFAEHGETLSMKGLILNCCGKKEEAYECCKKGLRNDIRSSICWHVYGLIQKSDRKYDEAIKCYLQALRLDKENMQILRDLSLLQIQMRDLEGYKDTRYQLFLLRPTHKASWIGYAMAHHLLDNRETALSVLEEFRKAQQSVKPNDYEHSEHLLYQSFVMVEAGKLDQALDHLNLFKADIVDKLAWQEARGEILLGLERYEDATVVYWDLIDRNSENKAYYELLCRSLCCESVEKKWSLFQEISSKYPRSLMAQRVPLTFLTGDLFLCQADAYLKPALRKGVPPLFIQMRSLYSDPLKVSALEGLYIGYKRSLESCGRLSEGEESETNPLEPPSTLIWANYLLAQHYNYMAKTKEALEIVDKQLEHTPTLIEFYALKGQIFRDSGDEWTGSEYLKEAQSLDTADRYINCQCTCYLIQAGRLIEAEEMAAKFTREGTSSAEHLNEMQCMWYLTEMGKAFRKMNKLGDALKKSHEVERHFSVILEDQFDFHSYCLRKMTLRSYVEMIRLEDKLRSHPFYFDAAKNAIEIYLQLHSHPVGDEDNLDDHESKNLSAAELKKLKNKQRKQKRKAEQEAERVRQEQEKRDAAQRSKQAAEKDADTDRSSEEKLDPAKLARPENPLEEAAKFLSPLLDFAPTNIETHCLAYEVYEKKEKPLLMLRSIRAGVKLGHQSHPWFHQCYVRFLLVVINNRETMSELVKQVLDSQMASIYPKDQRDPSTINQMASIYPKDQRDPSTINQKFLSQNSDSFPHLLAGLIVKYKIENKVSLDVLKNASPSMKGYTWQTCNDILTSLRTGQLGAASVEVVESFRVLFHSRFPLATAFLTPEEIQGLHHPLVDPGQDAAQSDQATGDIVDGDAATKTSHTQGINGKS